MAATRVLLVSTRTDISDFLRDDPGADQYELERRSPDFVDVEEAARDFSVVLIDLDTTSDGVSLGKSLRAARREVEFITIAGPQRERQAVESLKVGAYDYLVWPPPEPADLWALLAGCLKKLQPVIEEFPRQFGRFRLLRKLGSGGMAEVFLAVIPATKGTPSRACVVKAMHPHLASNAEFVRMFMDECRITSLLVHPNIVRVADFGRHDEIPYLVMEYVAARNLEELRREVNAPFPLGLACWIVAEICAGLAHAHAKRDSNGVPLNIVHRDVNPPNVLVAEDGRVLLTDFGIAKAAHRYYETTSGVLKGKFEYMSPEQAHGQPVDHRADLFSAGLILYELITATRPFLAPTPIETLFLIQQCNPVRPSSHEPRIPDELDDIVMKSLAREPIERYVSAAAMENDLREFARRVSNPGAKDLALFTRDSLGALPPEASLAPVPPPPQPKPRGVVPGGGVEETTVPPQPVTRPVARPRTSTLTPASDPVALLPQEDTITPASNARQIAREDTISGPIPVQRPDQSVTVSPVKPPKIVPPPSAKGPPPKRPPQESTIIGPRALDATQTNTPRSAVTVDPPPFGQTRDTPRGVVPSASVQERTVDEPRTPRVATGVQEIEIDVGISIPLIDDQSTTRGTPIPADTLTSQPALQDDTAIGRRPDESTAVNSDALLPAQPPGALPPLGADGTVIRPMGLSSQPIAARTPEKSTVSAGIFPGEAKSAELKRRLLRIGAVLGGVVVIGVIAVPIAGSLGGDSSPKPYGTPVVKATPFRTPVATEATPRATPTATVVAVTPRPTPTTTLVAVTPRPTPTLAPVTPRPTATPRATHVAAATPKPTPVAKGKGTLSVWVDGWASVEIDGKSTGMNAPFVGFAVPAGKHILTLQNQWARKDVEVTISAGKETKIAVELR